MDSKKYIEKDSLSAMLDDCAVILKNPKVRLDYFNISINDDQNTKIAKWLQEIVGSQHKIHSTNVTLSSFKTFDFISMLSFFKPGALETIDFGRLTNFTDFSQLTNLFEMDQWKFAQRVYLLSMDFDNFPIEQLSHLISFDIEWTETSVADAIKIKDIILRSPHFESASILSHCVNKIKPEVLKVFHPNYIATDRDYNEMLELRNDYFRSIVYAGGSSIDIYNVNLEDPDDFE